MPAFDRGRFAAVIPLPGAASMTVADGKLWVLSAPGRVVRIDPATNAVVGKPLPVPADAEAIASLPQNRNPSGFCWPHALQDAISAAY